MYVHADDFEDAKEKIRRIVDDFNKKHNMMRKIEAEDISKTAREGMFYYRIVEKKESVSDAFRRVHAQNYVKFNNG